MKRNVKNWMTKAAMGLALCAGMLSFAAPQASAQSWNQRLENDQLQKRNPYSNHAVNPVNPRNQQEQRRFTYQQPYREYGYGQHGYGQYGYGQYGHYGTPPQPYYQNQNRGWDDDDDDDRYYQRSNRR